LDGELWARLASPPMSRELKSSLQPFCQGLVAGRRVRSFGIVFTDSDRAAAERAKEVDPKFNLNASVARAAANISLRIRSANRLRSTSDCKAFQECLKSLKSFGILSLLSLFLGIETNPCIVFDRQEGRHTLPFAIENILLQVLDLNSVDKYIYRLYHQWLATFW
jgi:hypothetical protein